MRRAKPSSVQGKKIVDLDRRGNNKAPDGPTDTSINWTRFETEIRSKRTEIPYSAHQPKGHPQGGPEVYDIPNIEHLS